MAGRKAEKRKGFREELKFEAYGLVLLTFSLISLIGYGKMRYISFLFFLIAGSWGFLISLCFAGWGLYLMIRRRWLLRLSYRWSGFLLLLLAVLLLAHIRFYEVAANQGLLSGQHILSLTWETLWAQKAEHLQGTATPGAGGGMLGALLFTFFSFLFDVNGTKIVVILLLLLGLLLLTNLSYVRTFAVLLQWFRNLARAVNERLYAFFNRQLEKRQARQKNLTSEEEPAFKEPREQTAENKLTPEKRDVEGTLFPDMEQSDAHATDEDDDHASLAPEPLLDEAKRHLETTAGPLFEEKHALDEDGSDWKSHSRSDLGAPLPEAKTGSLEGPYHLPPVRLLKKGNKSASEQKNRSIHQLAKKLEQTLDSFGVRAKVTQVHRGPAVTRFELQPETGVKVSRIVSLADDMALALAAKDIRIEAPIPGKSALGIEVPNPEISIVTLREVIESPAFRDSDGKLSVALGRDISGEPVIGNLAKMPHLLVAGATGSGKSVCINGMIISLLYKARPDEVKFLMIDPKMVELSVYNEIPHLLIPVVTDPRKASMALKKVVQEMESRYQLFAQTGTRDIERYNQMMEMRGQEKLPYIVVIIDELADLMMVAPGDVEEAISRLAQMARAAGIHLIIATQRPSVDVITGLIKANIPSRIAFGVSSQVDSRTILDMAGAEKLLGRGDMLYFPVGYPKPVRVQGAFVSDREVEAVVSYVKSQQEASYREDLILSETTQASKVEEEDELFEAAMQLVIEAQQASVSLLQRRLHIGYTRAARLIDALESHGVVGPYEGSKPREVLIKPDQVG
jgi:S-DNA-T family DNA segregation ATPase FtsK/SpoIIIE